MGIIGDSTFLGFGQDEAKRVGLSDSQSASVGPGKTGKEGKRKKNRGEEGTAGRGVRGERKDGRRHRTGMKSSFGQMKETRERIDTVIEESMGRAIVQEEEEEEGGCGDKRGCGVVV